MQTEVNLQSDFSYPVIWVVLILLVLAAMVFLLFYVKKEKKPKETVIVKTVRNPYEIKQEYLGKIDQLCSWVQEKSPSKREIFYEISELVRLFAYEMTGYSVQNQTLLEIEQIGIPQLSKLIRECYMPEFYELENGDPMQTILHTREVVETWNINIPSC